MIRSDSNGRTIARIMAVDDPAGRCSESKAVLVLSLVGVASEEELSEQVTGCLVGVGIFKIDDTGATARPPPPSRSVESVVMICVVELDTLTVKIETGMGYRGEEDGG